MNRRSFILLLCLIVMAIIAVLAASMHDVQFEPGRSFAGVSPPETTISPGPLSAVANTPVWKILLLWLAFVVNLVLFFFILPPEARKRILRQLISLAVGVLVLLMALRYRVLQVPELFTNPAGPDGSRADQLAPGSELPTFQRPQATPWMTFLISLAVLWAVLIVVWLVYRWWKRQRAGQGASLAAIADIARSSLDDLASGRQWGDVVIQTYARMSDAVSTQRGLRRGATMTAREFASHLTRAGLPSDPVRGLTRLFEAVRYGGHTSSEREGREAVACLESILHACGAEA